MYVLLGDATSGDSSTSAALFVLGMTAVSDASLWCEEWVQAPETVRRLGAETVGVVPQRMLHPFADENSVCAAIEVATSIGSICASTVSDRSSKLRDRTILESIITRS